MVDVFEGAWSFEIRDQDYQMFDIVDTDDGGLSLVGYDFTREDVRAIRNYLSKWLGESE